jgi:hypothetical protein
MERVITSMLEAFPSVMPPQRASITPMALEALAQRL